MRNLIFAAAAAVSAFCLSAPPAAALPIGPAATAPAGMPGVADNGVIEARLGCGRGWTRDRRGRCRPMARRYYGPPGRYRALPPGFYQRPMRCWRQQTQWGWRRVCR